MTTGLSLLSYFRSCQQISACHSEQAKRVEESPPPQRDKPPKSTAQCERDSRDRPTVIIPKERDSWSVPLSHSFPHSASSILSFRLRTQSVRMEKSPRRGGQSFSHAPLAHISHLTESNISYRAQHDISQKETIHYRIVSFYFI